tara:strand:- start:47827 stop:48603 length:777 start_codon:yes stop_codon:yes gene_type:complete
MERLLACLLALSIGSSAAVAQNTIMDIEYDPAGEFNFVRVQFDTYGARGGFGGFFGDGGPPWSIDFPGADQNFLRGVARLTNVRVMQDPIVLRFDDSRIFDYPFLYMLEVGQQGGISLSPLEITNLREYLLRGGFLLIDDFWGTRQWDAFEASFSQVFPEREIVELRPDHEIFRTYYDLDGPKMIPALSRDDSRGEQDIDVASNHAILDDNGRIMVLINWNSDMGDGWEHTYHPYYPTRYANSAYQLGINYLIYAMTH